MQRYLLRRLLLMLPTLFGLTVIVFIMVRIIPGDIVALIAGDYGATSPETKQAILEEFGLDENIPLQYVKWVGRVARGDLGHSLISGRSVQGELSNRLPVTVELGALAILVSMVIALPVGIISAIRQNSASDYAGRSLAIGLLAAPNFWIAILLFTAAGKWFTWGVPPLTYVELTDSPIGNLKQMAMPALLVGAGIAGAVMRFTRSTMLEVIRQDYVRTARAKGLSEQAVIVRHALKNAMVPVITVIGLQVPVVLGGVIVIETVYGIPGMGRYYISAIRTLDFPVVQSINLVVALITVLSILVVDILYAWLNPRIRYA